MLIQNEGLYLHQQTNKTLYIMINEHKFDSFRLFYSEGTPHVWDMSEVGDDYTIRLYSDNLKYGADIIFRPYICSNDISIYRICKNGNHRTRGHAYNKTLEQCVDILKQLPVLKFDLAIEEFTRKEK